ncbi:EGFR adapter protein-like isoform X2 [Schistocerca gregaria]|uniref:EGFR adapter protein-like isoform X2 n=1 Tax=Schistocerca gregaria TaxID=7010 RepID=UPI00211EB65C|nr:EGFR adapter protein-like isoform X2 [Schistocerca gregaria]
MFVLYMGSFPVSGQDHASRAEYMRSQLLRMRGTARTKPVLLVISLAGIKVCTPDGKTVLMAHALRRVSYATCDPSHSQFSFLAREPRGHCSLQCCHSFLAKSPQQAEELHAAVGDAFRAAYAAQLQRDVSSAQQQKSGDELEMRPLGSGRSMAALTDDSPSSDESNSPTDLNSYRRLGDKPALVKRLGLQGGGGGGGGGGGHSEDSRPLLAAEHSPRGASTPAADASRLPPGCDSPPHARTPPPTPEKRAPVATPRHAPQLSGGSSSSDGWASPPPPLPERQDSLARRPEAEQLLSAPWFQAGIPREIALEVLGREPEGAFMVRESTSKPGCYALSLRVPRDFQPSGIAHYLILRTAKGYKIKGFTKEFSSLTALITHHSVMPELLPVPLSLSRYNPSFAKSDSNKDSADTDSDPDYNTLSDFRKMMADLSL